MQTHYSDSKKELVKTLGEIIKEKRLAQNKTIYKISAESSMSKSTWREAELGVCKDITLSTLWKIAEGLDIKLYDIIKELYEKLDVNFDLSDSD